MPTDIPPRFWAKVEKTPGCWNWTGSDNGRGYGQFHLDGRRWYVHRFSYEAHYGPLGGLEVDHRCHNPRCVRPDHLRAVTRKQNVENRGAFRNSRSGVRGVHPTKYGTWEARVKNNGVEIYLGTFATLAEASAAAREARVELFTHNDADRP